MSDLHPIPGPSTFDSDAVPDALRPGHLPTRDERMEEIYAHRNEVFRAELRGGAEEEGSPRPERRERPAASVPAAQPAPLYREVEIGGQRIALDEAQMKRLAETALQIPVVQQAFGEALQLGATQRNLATVEAEFPDIFSDMTRSRLAALTLVELRQCDAALGIVRDDLDAYRTACRDVRTGLAAGLPARRQRRAEADAAEPRGSSVVASMRRERGQFA